MQGLIMDLSFKNLHDPFLKLLKLTVIHGCLTNCGNVGWWEAFGQRSVHFSFLVLYTFRTLGFFCSATE
jgi:hypothetical protein